MTVYDAVAELVTLIETNWNSANTSGKTPNIGKITDYPFDLQMGDELGYILLYSIIENEVIPGIGQTTNANVAAIPIAVFSYFIFFVLCILHFCSQELISYWEM